MRFYIRCESSHPDAIPVKGGDGEGGTSEFCLREGGPTDLPAVATGTDCYVSATEGGDCVEVAGNWPFPGLREPAPRQFRRARARFEFTAI